MYRWLWLAIVLVSVGATADTRLGKLATPRIICENASWNFGRLENTNVVEHPYVVSNGGAATLQIVRTYSGCGCTSVLPAKTRLAPGEATAILVRFTLAGRQGPQDKSVYVDTNDPENSTLALHLMGEALQVAGPVGSGSPIWTGRAHVDPAAVDFGKVQMGVVSKRQLSLIGASSNDLVAVRGIESLSPSVWGTVCESNGETSIEVCLRVGNVIGPDGTSLTIHTRHPELPSVTVPVIWQGEGDYAATPAEITYAISSTETNRVVRYVAIRSLSGKPVRISHVELPFPGTSGTMEQGSLDRCVCSISSVSPPVGSNGSRVTIRLEDGAAIIVPVVVQEVGSR